MGTTIGTINMGRGTGKRRLADGASVTSFGITSSTRPSPSRAWIRGSSRRQVISEFDDNVVRAAEANVLQRASTAEGVFPNGSPLFRRSYYVCPNGHWSIADSDAKILPCNSCTQIAECDYEIIERRSRASRAEASE